MFTYSDEVAAWELMEILLWGGVSHPRHPPPSELLTFGADDSRLCVFGEGEELSCVLLNILQCPWPLPIRCQ